jgi:hypothetical protein
MATTTPNFGWPVPTSTDLVKDGATAIEALGDSIDASLLDLKGGTTGQILSKASNTDLDYTWITNDVGDITAVTAGTGISGGGTSGAVTITNSMATAIDAKGDLVAGTGADAFNRLAVGTNNTKLVAASGETTGMKWVGFQGVSLYNTTNQSVSSSTWTATTFNTEDFDTDGFHSTSSNTSRITIPTGLDGKYLFTGVQAWTANTTSIRGLQLYKNGAILKALFLNAPSPSYETFQSYQFIVDAVAGDYFEVFNYQETGSALNLQGGFSFGNHFQAQYLGA